ncbi:MAG: FixH family protein [Alphaproteobacteria bacterium]|nr:FixH family protein [Alphaproteobacteria bacterium]
MLSACGQAESSYTFSAITQEVAMDGDAVIDVRLIQAPTGKPVTNAVIFDTRFDMSPDGMGGMAAPVESQGSPEPGVYRFKVAPTMGGRWALTLNAKVQGIAETITGTVVVTVH